MPKDFQRGFGEYASSGLAAVIRARRQRPKNAPTGCGAAEHDTRGARSSVRRRGAVIVLLP